MDIPYLLDRGDPMLFASTSHLGKPRNTSSQTESDDDKPAKQRHSIEDREPG